MRRLIPREEREPDHLHPCTLERGQVRRHRGGVARVARELLAPARVALAASSK